MGGMSNYAWKAPESFRGERKYMTKELKMSDNFPKDGSRGDCNMYKVFR